MNRKYFLNLLFCLLIALLLISSSGCSMQQYGAVKFTSTPPGAEVVNLKDDTVLGTTPVRVLWKGSAGSSEKVVVQFRKKGYFEKIIAVWVNKRHNNETNAISEATEMHAELVKN